MEEKPLPTRRKTENRSFRIDSMVLAGLEDEASRKKVSVNTLVNQLLADYIDVGRHRLRLGTVSLTSSAFHLLIGSATDDDLAKVAASSGKAIPRAYSSSKWGHETPENVLGFIRDNASVTGLFDYSESTGSPKTITLTHPFGRKWSIYLSAFFKSAFDDVGQRVQIETSDQAVVLKLG